MGRKHTMFTCVPTHERVHTHETNRMNDKKKPRNQTKLKTWTYTHANLGRRELDPNKTYATLNLKIEHQLQLERKNERRLSRNN